MIVRKACRGRLDPGADVLRVTEFGLLAGRLLLAFVFLLAGSTKLVDPVGLRQTWREFGLPAALARPMILLLPLLELTVAVLLIPSVLAWYGACGALALLVVFVLAIGLAMARGRKPDCRCFGRVHSAPVGWQTLLRDGLLAACAGWLVWRGPFHSGPEVWVWVSTLNTDERKVVFLAALLATFFYFRLLNRARPQSQPIESLAASDSEEEDFWADDPAPARATEERQPAPVRRPPRPAAPPAEEPAPSHPGAQGIGLPVGTPAPEFQLPGINGEKRSLQSLRAQGKDLLLVFSSPYCEPCHALAPKLGRWAREMEGTLNVFLVSRGTVRDNLAKLKEFDPSRILLQRDFEVSEAYDCNATPTAVVVGADGLIRSELAVGRETIQQLMASLTNKTVA
jgi:peroxiredoxin